MSSTLKPKIQCFTAGEDLSTHQYKAVKYGADRQTIVLAGAGERGIGVLQNTPALGDDAEVAVEGGALIKVASNVTLGASCAVGASGVGVNAGAATFSIGVFQDSGVSGDVVAIIIDRHNSAA